MRRWICAGIAIGFLTFAMDTVHAAEILIQPRGANGNHTIVGRDIELSGGGQRVFFDIFFRGFAPQPLMAYQVVINTAVTSNLGSTLGPAIQSCPSANSTGHLSCATAFNDFGLGSPRCYTAFPSGNLQCEAGWINKVRTDWIFYGTSPVSAVDLNTPLFRWGSTVDFSELRADEGTTYYAGSLAVDVPANAAGTFVLSLDAGQTKLYNSQSFPNDEILPRSLLGATITIAPPCTDDPSCSDTSVCTIDFCDNGTCVHEPLAGCTGWKSFANCLTGPAASVSPGCAAFDLDEDGHVDLWDVALLLR